MEAESTFSPRELQDLECLPFPFQLNWIWLKEMHQMSGLRNPMFSIWQFPRLRSSSFPLTHNSCPSSSQNTEKVPGPPPYSPLCQSPVQLSSSHPLSQLLLSEVTRYFGPDDRGVNGNFHPTQMRSCMWTLSANDKTLIRQMQEVVTLQLWSSLPYAHSRHAIGKGSPLLYPGTRVHFLLPLTASRFPRFVSVGENWVRELRMRRQAQLFIDHPQLQNVKDLPPIPTGTLSVTKDESSKPENEFSLMNVSSYTFRMFTGHRLCLQWLNEGNT